MQKIVKKADKLNAFLQVDKIIKCKDKAIAKAKVKAKKGKVKNKGKAEKKVI